MSGNGEREPIDFTIQCHVPRQAMAYYRLDWLPQSILEELAGAVARELRERELTRREWGGRADELRADIANRRPIVKELLRKIRAAQRIVYVLGGGLPESVEDE